MIPATEHFWVPQGLTHQPDGPPYPQLSGGKIITAIMFWKPIMLRYCSALHVTSCHPCNNSVRRSILQMRNEAHRNLIACPRSYSRGVAGLEHRRVSSTFSSFPLHPAASFLPHRNQGQLLGNSVMPGDLELMQITRVFCSGRLPFFSCYTQATRTPGIS